MISGSLEVRYDHPARFHAYERNARIHDDTQRDQIVASIKQFGFVNPILVDEADEIIAGHGRQGAALQMGLESIPYIVLAGLDETQKRALRVADNKIAINATWDYGLVIAELEGLNELSVLTGFSGAELRSLLRSDDMGSGQGGPHYGDVDVNDEGTDEGVSGALDADKERPLITRPGDCWRLGRHRLLCGDNGDPSNIGRLMVGNVANLIFTSPPYLSQRTYGGGGGDWQAMMRNACSTAAAYCSADAQMLVNLGIVHEDGEWSPYWNEWLDWMRSDGWKRFGLYVWDQGPGLPGDWAGRLAPSFELVFHLNRRRRNANRTTLSKEGGKIKSGKSLRGANDKVPNYTHLGRPHGTYRVPDAVIRVNRAKGVAGHPAPFPIGLAELVIDTFSDEGDAVLDPFGGSGTTLLAAQRTNRTGYCVEIEPRYVDIALRRFMDAHPDEAVILDSEDAPDFATVAEGRQ